MLALPKAGLSDEEQAFLDNEVEQLCAMIDDWDITHVRQDLSPEVWQFIKDKGFFGMIIPKEYGGLEFSAQAHSAVVTKVASRSGYGSGDGDGAEFAGAGRIAVALRNPGAKGQIPAPPCQRSRKFRASH